MDQLKSAIENNAGHSRISEDTVQKIFNDYYTSSGKTITQLREYLERERRGFGAIVNIRSYVVHLADDSSYILLVSGSADELASDTPALCTPLSVHQSLLKLISGNTSIPQPTPFYHSDTQDIIPAEYLILSCPPGAPLSDTRRTLSETQNTLIDLQIGRWMREMHDRVQNEWFGLPKTQPVQPVIPSFSIPGLFASGGGEEEPSYSWQESFTTLLEELMGCAESRGLAPGVSFGALRMSLGRAIGSFLFDDCEVPSLVSFLGDEGSVFVEVNGEEPRITSLLPPTYALWGDPLLETFFLTTENGSVGPSQALLEGYGGNPIVFRRQKTKRTWYDVFLCLAVLVASGRASENEEQQAKVEWSQQRLKECAEILKDAPCY